MRSDRSPIRLGLFGGTAFQFAFLLTVISLLLAASAWAPLGCGWGKPVALPFAPSAPLVAEDDHDVSVSLQSDGFIYIDAKWYPDAEFQAKMLEFGTRSRAHRFVIKADRSLPFSRLRFVLQSLRAGGHQHVLLMTFQGHPLQLLGKRAA